MEDDAIGQLRKYRLSIEYQGVDCLRTQGSRAPAGAPRRGVWLRRANGAVLRERNSNRARMGKKAGGKGRKKGKKRAAKSPIKTCKGQTRTCYLRPNFATYATSVCA
jgi:hypothetical protein